jgi:hypothetical protein
MNMKCPRFMLSAVVLMSFAALAFAQSDVQKDMQKPATPSDAQKSFDTLKTLAGSWEGLVKTVPVQSDVDGKPMQVTLRVTSMGNALMRRELEGLTIPSPCCIWTGAAWS